ncbi:hypothetical protein WM40_25525 [Robbsia andropogonis]|uniref:Pyocin large subunit-like protein n=1 Tax=Robbsia andropogonis TaxID=28092 RepID=A0A0F5JTV2_9BURK|nr:hypothetical protein [Robbsia andropogonis]KKB61044.1 hypothetical protein WM40_25525 [Robbsia andropogonis]
MAGDWIKMRSDLHTSPKVVRISSALKADRLRTIGGLHSVWSLFDVHSEDGFMDGYTLEILDDLIGFPGFGAAMVSVGWLTQEDEGLAIPRFDEHNGQSAKRRAQDSERKRVARQSGNVSASEADKSRTREEKRREEIKPSNANALLVDSDADDALPTLDLTSQDSTDAAEPHAGHPACPHQQIIALYHAILPSNPAIRDWTPARQATLRVRWNEDRRRQNLDWWRGFFEYVSHSRFLTGRASQHDRKPFTPGLEWLLKAENFAKIREGRYEDEEVTA